MGHALALALFSVAAPPPPLVLTPSALTTAPGGTQTFTATGGVPPYTFTLPTNGSSGSIVTHATTVDYTCGSTGSTTDVVRVTDSKSVVTNATVTVTAAIAISPTTQAAEAGISYTFAGSGGATPYVYSIATNNTGGSINSSTGVYKCGATTGSGNDTVRVTDANGKHADAAVTPSWTPYALGSVISWVRADQGVTLNGSAVSAWKDLKDATSAVQATGAKQPAQPATNAKLNNQLSIGFSGSQGLVQGALATAPAVPWILGVVFSDVVNVKYVADCRAADGANLARVQCNNGAGWTWGASGSALQESAYDAAGHLFIGLANTTASSERKDNMTTLDGSAGTATLTATGFTIGNESGLGASAGSNIAEVFVCNADLSSGDKTLLRSYIQTRYGLTIGA